MDKKSINDLLEHFHFVVPEIQREYVWGAAKNKRVLSQFLQDLDNKLEHGDACIGFLYSYRSGTEHYLIDGQQRYTTLLLLGYFLAATAGGEARNRFVSRLMLDSNEPAFAYRVRSNTESFMRCLLKSGTADAKRIHDQTWYKHEYDNDPTIISMIGAIDVFGTVVKECRHLTLDNIMSHVFFWYFDVEQTSQGEELYITMNSRGEKLTDSEQIKPRLLRRCGKDKNRYGKAWDEWEEFFYRNRNVGKQREIGTIDIAMNNIIRIVLELKTCHEHDRLNPVEDAETISIEDVETYMNALTTISTMADGRYLPEIGRLYGDSNEDGDFYTLKALLTEKQKGMADPYEYRQVYETVRNHVRRNKLKNRPFLAFLSKYAASQASWYDSITAQDEESAAVFNGHELEKIQICRDMGQQAEDKIWKAQAHSFWNGDIRQLTAWAKGGDGKFCLDTFIKYTRSFNLLFDRRENDGWTSDLVRQALIVRLTYYPLDGCFFGYTSDQWRQIMKNNSTDFKHFLDEFAGMDSAEQRDRHLQAIRESYPETPGNKWAEFVWHDYLLDYCNTKRVQWRAEYGIECVKNSYKQPYSVKNMHLEHYLRNHLNDNATASGWNYWVDLSGWQSVVKLYRYDWPIHIWLQYRADKHEQYEITVRTNDGFALSESDKHTLEASGFVCNDDNVYCAYAPVDNMAEVMKRIEPCFKMNAQNKTQQKNDCTTEIH